MPVKSNPSLSSVNSLPLDKSIQTKKPISISEIDGIALFKEQQANLRNSVQLQCAQIAFSSISYPREMKLNSDRSPSKKHQLEQRQLLYNMANVVKQHLQELGIESYESNGTTSSIVEEENQLVNLLNISFGFNAAAAVALQDNNNLGIEALLKSMSDSVSEPS